MHSDFENFDVSKSGSRIILQNDEIICTLNSSGDVFALDKLRVYKHKDLPDTQKQSILKKILEHEKFKELIGVSIKLSYKSEPEPTIFDNVLKPDTTPLKLIEVLSAAIEGDMILLKKMCRILTASHLKPNLKTLNLKEVSGAIKSNTGDLAKQISKLQKQLSHQKNFKVYLRQVKRLKDKPTDTIKFV